MSQRNTNAQTNSADSERPEVSHRRTASATRRKAAVSRLLEDGDRFGKYEIVRWIARGGMSEVYEAIHTGLKKPVALKVLRGEMAENAEARERFVAEGSNAALVRHPNVVDVSDVGIIDELPYLVMELLEGEALGTVYARAGRLPVTDVVDLLLPVAAAVGLAHEHGVIHRDLKPDNVFLQYEGRRVIPKVLDFGASRVLHDRRITMNVSVLGTPHYMSPEQARGEKSTDARTDQYALGVMLYEGITGRLPRESNDPLELLHQVAYGPFRPPSELGELPEGLEAVIVRALAREPSQRFATMRDFALALVPFASDVAREYWSVELAFPSTGRNPDIAQPPVSPQRLSPFRTSPPPAPDGADASAVVNLPEAEVTLLQSSRPPPQTGEEDPLALERRSARKRLIIGGVLVAAALVGGVSALVYGGRSNSSTTENAAPTAADEANVPNNVAADTLPTSKTTGAAASAEEAAPEATASSPPAATRSPKASRSQRHAAAAAARPSEKAVPARSTAEPPARTTPAPDPTPKVRVIEDNAPKVKVIE
jgi:eukaryotic-like serine/threonine-protein kinase